MKRIIIFIGLKVVEVIGLGVLATGLALIGNYVENLTNKAYGLTLIGPIFSSYSAFFISLMTGFASLCLLVLASVACVGIYFAIKANWHKAGEIAGRGKG